MDVFGNALQDLYYHQTADKLLLHTNYGEPEEMPIEVFFRNEDELPELENYALDLCRGTILDIGAGAGSHALILQQKGFEVTALELSSKATAIMKERGVKGIINTDIFTYRDETYDTLLMLMNGIGLTENLQRLRLFLEHAKRLIKPGGQLLFDSSDIAYLYKDNHLPPDRYYGQIAYRYQYQMVKGSWFNWLYIDQELLCNLAYQCGWKAQIIYEDHQDHYLARLILKESKE